MPLPAPVLSAFRSVVGDDHVLDDPSVTASYTTDWTGRFAGRTPCVVRPGDVQEIAEILRVARAHRIGLVPQGGNTGLVGGSVPLAGEVVLSTVRLHAIEDVDADSGQLTAGAGATIAAVQTAAERVGWRYGVDLAARDSATVGGSVATDAGGLRVMRHGSTRRQVMGVEAVLGTGEVVSRLDGLTKDNTGYDLAGMLCGSEGTLGVVARARLALVPAGSSVVTALLGFSTVTEAVRAVGSLRRSVPMLEAVELVLRPGCELVAEQTGESPVLDPLPAVQVLVEAVGPPDPTAVLSEGVESLHGVLDAAVATDALRRERLWYVREAHTEAIGRIAVPHKYDVTLPGSALADFVDEIPGLVEQTFPEAQTWLFGHLADGNIHVNVTGVDPSRSSHLDDVVLGEVVRRRGSISAEHGIGVAKKAWLIRNRTPSDLAAMRAIKAAFDPDHVLNPNVLL